MIIFLHALWVRGCPYIIASLSNFSRLCISLFKNKKKDEGKTSTKIFLKNFQFSPGCYISYTEKDNIKKKMCPKDKLPLLVGKTQQFI